MGNLAGSNAIALAEGLTAGKRESILLTGQ